MLNRSHFPHSIIILGLSNVVARLFALRDTETDKSREIHRDRRHEVAHQTESSAQDSWLPIFLGSNLVK